MPRPASAQTTSRSMKSGKPARYSSRRRLDDAVEHQARRQIAEQAADAGAAQVIELSAAVSVGSGDEGDVASTMARHGAGEKEEADRARDRRCRPGSAAGAAASCSCRRGSNSAWWCARSGAAPPSCRTAPASACRRRRIERIAGDARRAAPHRAAHAQRGHQPGRPAWRPERTPAPSTRRPACSSSSVSSRSPSVIVDLGSDLEVDHAIHDEIADQHPARRRCRAPSW